MLIDNFIPALWFNNNFSYLKNFEVAQWPHEEWVRMGRFFFIKKPWFYTEYDSAWNPLRQLTGNFVWKYIVNDIMYVWDDLCYVYTFQKNVSNQYELVEIYNNPDALNIYTQDLQSNFVQQRSLQIQYLTENLSSWTVASATNTGGWGTDTELVVNEAGTFNITDVWKFVYFTSWDWVFQIRQILVVVDAVTVWLNEAFYVIPSAWDNWETYDRYDDVIVFNNLKHADWRVLTYEVTTGDFHLRFLWWKDIAIYDGRFWILNEHWAAVWWSVLTWEYEIPDLTTARWDIVDKRWEKILSIQPYKTYLVLFYKTSIAIVWQIGQDASWNPIYNYNEIVSWVWIFSPTCYTLKEWSLYIFTRDKSFVWLEIKPQSTNIIEWVLIPQADIIQGQLNNIKTTDYVECFSYDVWVGVFHSNPTIGTRIHKYTTEYKWRYYHESLVELKNYFWKLYDDKFICAERFVCIEWWESDLWNNIEQEVQVIWPWENYWNVFTILQIKILLWFYENIMDFEIELDLGGEKFIWTIYDKAKWIAYIKRQNMASASWALWTLPLSFTVLWGINSLKDKISRIWLMWLRVGKSWVYYKVTIRNKDNKNFNFWSIMVQMKEGNPLTVPLGNVT